MQEPQIRYAKTSDGVNIAWYAIGSGPAFVWGAGAGTSAAASLRMPEFREIIEVITRQATLVSFDARGFGMSDRGPMDFSSDAFVKDLEAVVDAASVHHTTLQSFSNGAIPAVKFAARHADRVAALILLNGIMRGSDMSPTWSRLVRLANEDWSDAVTWLARMNQAGYAETATIERSRQIFEEATTKEAFLSFCHALQDWDCTEEIGQVATPALVMHYSSQSSFTPLEASRRMAASLPNGRFVPIELAEGERTIDAAASVIRRFLAEVLPADARAPRRAAATPAPVPSGTAIILFADIVDSTALTERLGDAAFRDKARDLNATLRKLIRDESGTPIEGPTLGDGLLATFTSARQAIEVALACSRAGGDVGLPLHLGLHAGDVLREKDEGDRDNVYGVAARISGLSAPGEVLVSDIVRGLARTSSAVTFEDRGEQALKGVGEPVRVWAVREDGA